MKGWKVAGPGGDVVEELFRKWPNPPPTRLACSCERIGCPNDHSEHYRRKAALRRLIDREVKRGESA